MPRDTQNSASNLHIQEDNFRDSSISGSASETSLNSSSATFVNNRPDTLCDATFRFRTPAELLTVLERNHLHSFTLDGGNGINSFHRLLKDVDGKILSDGTIIKASLRGRISFLPPTNVGASGNTQCDLITDLTILKRGIQRSIDRSIPLNFRIDSANISDDYLQAYFKGFVRLISGKEGLKIRFYANEIETLNKVQYSLDGMQLPDGDFIRVDREGQLSIQKYYRLGENGWSERGIRRDINVINHSLLGHQGDKINTVVWIPFHDFNQSLHAEIRRSLQESLSSFRKAGIANNLVLKTESSHADKLPGFLRMSSHAVVVERSPEHFLTEDLEKVAIASIEDFISNKQQSKPFVIWVKLDDLGKGLLGYLADLKLRYQDDLKIIGTNKLLENIAELAQPPSYDLNSNKPSKWSIKNIVTGAFSKLRASPTKQKLLE